MVVCTLPIPAQSSIRSQRTEVEQYVVAYAKIQTDKDEIILQGVFFGGISDTQAGADNIAKDCVNTTKGGTILPKVMKITCRYSVMNAMFDAYERFERIVTYMTESNNTIKRTTSRKKKKR